MSPTLVYYVKSKQNRPAGRSRRAEVAATSRRTATTDPVELVMRVKQLAGEVGGLRNLKMLVDLLAEG